MAAFRNWVVVVAALVLALCAPTWRGNADQTVVGTNCNTSLIYDASTNGATQLQASNTSGTGLLYICGYTFFAAGTVNVDLVYGTGTACATGTTKLTPAYQFTAQTGIVDASPFYRGMSVPGGQNLCINTSAGVAVQAVVYVSRNQ